jgi:hypothetical protein
MGYRFGTGHAARYYDRDMQRLLEGGDAWVLRVGGGDLR